MHKFLKEIKPHAIKSYSTSNVLPSVLAAQAVLETGWGESELAKKANNLFGIKGDYKGQSYTVRTPEQDKSGNTFYINAAFRKYPSYTESFEDRAAFFTSTDWRAKTYKAVTDATNYKTQVKALDESPYATDVNYGDKLLEIIEDNKLYEWDEEATGKKTIVFMSPIDYLVSKKFRITSDPNEYYESYNPNRGKKPWGQRDLWERHNGKIIYHDTFCDGAHPGYDLSDKEGADIPAVVDGIIVDGTRQNGNFGGTVVLADHKGDYQYIYGHVKNITVKIGDRVKQGDKLAEQSNTNFYNNPMNSHLHFQVQHQKYYAKEKDFVCTGIRPEGINVNDYASTPTTSSPSQPKKDSTTAKAGEHKVTKGDTLWSISQKYNTTVDRLKSLNNLKNNVLSIGQILKITNAKSTHTVVKGDTLWSLSQTYNTTVNKLKSLNNLKTNTLSIGQELKVGGSTNSKPKFNKMANRKLSKSAHFKGTVDKAGAEVRNRSGSNFNKKAGYDLKTGDEVFIFQVVNGWGKIYTSKTSGNGSNDWIWLERLNVTEVF